MIDHALAASLNISLLKPGSAVEASKQLNPGNMQKLIATFPLFDPYVQATIIESIVLLNDHQFEAIMGGYQDLINIGIKSENKWVSVTAEKFQNYPLTILPNEQIKVDLPNCTISNLLSNPTQPTHINPIHFTLWEEDFIKPPSQLLPEPGIRKPKKPDIPPESILEKPKPLLRKPSGSGQSTFPVGNREAQKTNIYNPRLVASNKPKKQMVDYNSLNLQPPKKKK